MRVAMVGPFGFHPNKTMRARALPLARALSARGHQVAIFMPPWHTPEEAERRWTEDGVHIRNVSLGGGVPGIARQLVREVNDFTPDVVHTFKPKAYSGLVAFWLWYTAGGKMRLLTDSDDWEGTGGWNDRAPYSWLQKRFFAWQERWGMTHCHRLTVASRALETLAWSHGVPAGRTLYLPNGPGIGTATAEKAAARRGEVGVGDRPVLLLYSRLFEFETSRLTTILTRLKSRLPDLAILAVGSGLYDEDTRAVRRQFEDAGLLNAVIDLGWLDEAALPATLAAADVGLYLMDDTLLNRTKCPVKLADMLHVGLPVVAEAVGQVPEYVVHGRTGVLCPAGDVDALTRALHALLTDHHRRRVLGAAAREHIATRFSWARHAERLEAAYAAR
jgi:glycosyltransferase involved in cell wall biosynthesis